MQAWDSKYLSPLDTGTSRFAEQRRQKLRRGPGSSVVEGSKQVVWMVEPGAADNHGWDFLGQAELARFSAQQLRRGRRFSGYAMVVTVQEQLDGEEH